jgi:hypothetical protein
MCTCCFGRLLPVMCLAKREAKILASQMHALILPRYGQDVSQAARERLLTCSAGKSGIGLCAALDLPGNALSCYALLSSRCWLEEKKEPMCVFTVQPWRCLEQRRPHFTIGADRCSCWRFFGDASLLV